MASIEELLRYLEQFMTGHLNQQHASTPSGAGIPGGGFSGGGGGGPVGGGVPQGGAPQVAEPGGPAQGNAAQGNAAQGGPMMAGSAGQGQLPPELENATAQQVQEALLQFAAMHPELAPFFTQGNQPADLSGALGQLTGIPAEALTGFTPAMSDFELGNFGGLAADEIGQWSQAQSSDLSFADPISGLVGDTTGLASSVEPATSALDGIDGIDGLLSTGVDPTDLSSFGGGLTDGGTLVSHDNVFGDLGGFSAAPGEFGNLAPTGFDDGAVTPGDFAGLAADPAAAGLDASGDAVDHTTVPVADPTAPEDFSSGPVFATDHDSPFSDSATDGSGQF
jgi:hypothetical protein